MHLQSLQTKKLPRIDFYKYKTVWRITMCNETKKRSKIAKALACKSLRMRIVAAKKGKGSYKRQAKFA